MQDEFKRIPVKNIIADPNQPRKHFDEGKLAELAESITINDVLEPLLVRRTKSANKDVYMIVVGERRYRASLIAGLADVPCMVRKLNDQEALEVQITENLQREDINPMEEAQAFRGIIKSKTYSVEALAARLGKRGEYVRQRLRLCELILSWQELMYASKLRITDANLLCRFGLDQQVAFYNQYVPKEWEKLPEGWVLPAMQLVEKTKNLDEAPFKTEDPTLNPLMGVCGKCTYNSQVSQLPFAGHEGSRTCSNPACYHIKEQNSHRQKVAEATQNKVLLIAGGTYSPQAKEQIQEAEKTGQPVLRSGDYEVLREPELLPREKYEKEWKWKMDGRTEEQKQEVYDTYVAEVETKKADYNFKKTQAQQALVVAADYGNEKTGAMVEVYIPQPEPEAIASEKQTEEAIATLQRQKERDIKTMNGAFLKDLYNALKESDAYWNNEKPLELKDTLVLLQILMDGGERNDEAMKEQLCADWGKPDVSIIDLVSSITSTGKTGFLYKWVRRLVLGIVTDYDITDAGGLSLRLLAERYVPLKLAELQKLYKAKQKVLIDATNEKIAALQHQKIPVAEVEQPTPATEGVGAFAEARKKKGLKALLENVAQ